MQSPMEVIAAKLGLTLDDLMREAPVPPKDQGDKHEEVRDSPEFRRVAQLPRRPPPGPDQPHVVALAKSLTEMLQRHPNPYPGNLRPLQAAALHEAWLHGGLLGPIGVGQGKTLISYLIPAILGAKRPLYIAPAALEKDVGREFAKMAQSWRGPHPSNFPFLSYELLSSRNSGEKRDSKGELLRVDLLERIKPDVIICDEVHKVRNSTAVCTKRMKRYIQNNPDVKIIALSGTLTRRSLKDFSHIAKWCLRANCPLPTTYSDLEAWSSALDEIEALGPRTEIGALIQLCSDKERAQIAAAAGAWDETEQVRNVVRVAVQRRLNETPGVVASNDGPFGVPLEIVECAPLREDPAINEAFVNMRLLWQLPNDRPIVDGMELARHCKNLGTGFYVDWVPRPPDAWMDARREWAGWARDVIRHNRRNIDSESQVKEAVRTGVLKDFGLLAQWEAVEPTYDPEAHQVIEWISSEAVDTAREWIKHHTGIIWVDSIVLGEELGRKLGIPHYGAEGMSKDGVFILDHKCGSYVASKQANGTGRNLFQTHESLWFTTPDEQSIGRQHRPGQMADKVSCHYFIGCWEHRAAFDKALNKALYAEQISGNSQRLCYAQKTLPTLDEVESREGPRWSK